MNLSLRNQRGIGLLELMLSLAIIAILLIMATRYFTSANTNQQVSNATDMFNGVRASVNSYYSDNGPAAQAPTLSGLVTAGYLPSSYGGSTSSPWGTAMSIPSATAGHFSVQMSSVPASACAMLIARLGQTINTASASGESVSPTSCGTGSSDVTVTYSR